MKTNHRQQAMRGRSSSGFTLIEILCCILIVSVLAVILIPVFAKAAHRARISNGTVQLKQLHHAFELYKLDYEPQSSPPFGYPDILLLQWRYSVVGKEVYNEIGIEESLFRSRCGEHPHWRQHAEQHGRDHRSVTDFSIILSSTSTPEYQNEFLHYFEQPNPPIVVDANCSDADVNLLSHYAEKLFLRLRLDGSVEQLRTTKPMTYMHFEDPNAIP